MLNGILKTIKKRKKLHKKVHYTIKLQTACVVSILLDKCF